MPKTTYSSDKTQLDEDEALITATAPTSEIINVYWTTDDDCDQWVQLCLPTQVITQDVSHCWL